MKLVMATNIGKISICQQDDRLMVVFKYIFENLSIFRITMLEK